MIVGSEPECTFGNCQTDGLTKQTDGKVTSAPMGALEVKLNSLLVNYD